MKIRIWVDRIKCTTFASCTIDKNPVYILDDEGKAVLDMDVVKSYSGVTNVSVETTDKGPVWTVECNDTKWIEENITAGALRCPVFAIEIDDLDSGKRIFPN